MEIWRLRIDSRMHKATNTHSEYVIPISFALLQWLNKRTSLLRYKYIACHVINCFTFYYDCIAICARILKFFYISLLLLCVTILYIEFVFLGVWVCFSSRVPSYEFWLKFWSIFFLMISFFTCRRKQKLPKRCANKK